MHGVDGSYNLYTSSPSSPIATSGCWRNLKKSVSSVPGSTNQSNTLREGHNYSHGNFGFSDAFRAR